MYKDREGEWRWVFYAKGNGEEIAVSSESYVAKADCKRGVEIMQQQSADAHVYWPQGT